MDKAHILREIKRTAAANDGVPLGAMRFANETGIRRPDWYGRFWARWGDALREAGYSPNDFTEAYDASELLNQFAELASELGHLPTSGEIRLKSKSSPGFAASTTFDRLGSKAEIVKLLADHCRSVGGYEDVIRMCAEYAPRARTTAEGPAAAGTVMGYVYLTRTKRFTIRNINAAMQRDSSTQRK